MCITIRPLGNIIIVNYVVNSETTFTVHEEMVVEELKPTLPKAVLLHSLNELIPSELSCSEPKLFLILLGVPSRSMKDPCSQLSSVTAQPSTPLWEPLSKIMMDQSYMMSDTSNYTPAVCTDTSDSKGYKGAR